MSLSWRKPAPTSAVSGSSAGRGGVHLICDPVLRKGLLAACCKLQVAAEDERQQMLEQPPHALRQAHRWCIGACQA